MCPGLPAAAGTGSKPWPRKCKGAAIGATCTAQCATAAGYAGNATARCLVNAAGEPQWSAPGNQCVKKLESAACLGTPPFDLRRKAVWPPNDGCNGTASGQKCYADCWDPYQGGGFSSTCANDTWLPPVPDHQELGFPWDGCTPHTPSCGSKPPPFDVPGAAWEPDCKDLPEPLSCAAPCVAPYAGEGYWVRCMASSGGDPWGELQGAGCSKP
ncbi:hypothetical protein OEZ85_002043 [Tetradesmus obliquus]|uniref:Sushi domain-containing protein n=1 Tax=Tetradesmus obliquus TaxID=3088 RepID=A0ABY8U4J6_TETOB|nr:hypothetical protein OEZ85_002043 [Tetradesmus obliquus]